MADTSLFSRLQRLFSSDVIIRNIGGKRLKVMDTGRIQKYGNLATNSLYDRFTRLHKPVGSSLQYNPTLNYQSMRLQLYSDYEAMDHDPIIAAALDIMSDETTTRNEYGETLNINSSKTPGDVYVLNLISGKLVQWTKSEVGGLNTESFVDTELVEISSFDG